MGSKHTSIPWKASAPDASYHDVIRIYSEGDSEGAIPVAVCPQRNSAIMEVLAGSKNETTEAACNAALIIRAVNNHERLLAACEAALGALSAYEYVSADGTQTIREQVKAALAAARKEGG